MPHIPDRITRPMLRVLWRNLFRHWFSLVRTPKRLVVVLTIILATVGFYVYLSNGQAVGMRTEVVARGERIQFSQTWWEPKTNYPRGTRPDLTVSLKEKVAATSNVLLDTTEPEVTQEEIVKFEDATPLIETEHDRREAASVGGEVNPEKTVKDFLQIPQKLSTFIWEDSMEQGEILWEAEFPQVFMKYRWWEYKCNNFTYLKGTVAVEVRINAQPMQLGALLGAFAPDFIEDHEHIANLFQMPHELTTTESGTVMTMMIPFIQPYAYVDITRVQKTRLAKFRLVVASPFRSGSCQISIWCRLMDAVLLGPNPRSLDPAFTSTNSRLPQEFIQEFEELKEKYRRALRGKGFFAQVGNEDIGNVVSGAASTLANAVGKIGQGNVMGAVEDVLGGAVNTATDIAQNVAADMLVSAATAAFGFSKPFQTDNETVVLARYTRSMAQHDGPFQGKKFTLNRAAQLEPAGLMGSQDDEMTIAHISRTMGYVGTFSMDVEDDTGKQLFEWKVSPQTSLETHVGPKITKYSTPLAALSSLFQFWTGDLIYIIVPIKTKYHSGMVKFNWQIAEPVNQFGSMAMAPRVVCNLAGTEGCIFTVPYLNNYAAMPVTPCTGIRESNGHINVEVVNSLRVGGGAPPKIDFLVFTAAAENFSLFGPTRPKITIEERSMDIPPGALIHDWVTKTSSYTAQVGGDMGFVYDPKTIRQQLRSGITPNPILETMPDTTVPERVMLCSGDPVASVKQLLNRFQALGPLPANSVLYNSFSLGLKKQSILAYWAQNYQFWRGSVRALITPPDQDREVPVSVIMSPQFVREKLNYTWSGYPQQLWFPSLEGPLEVEIPYYNYRPFGRVFGRVAGYDKATYDLEAEYDSTPSLSVNVEHETKIWMAAGDDYQLGFWQGAKPTILNVTRTTTYWHTVLACALSVDFERDSKVARSDTDSNQVVRISEQVANLNFTNSVDYAVMVEDSVTYLYLIGRVQVHDAVEDVHYVELRAKYIGTNEKHYLAKVNLQNLNAWIYDRNWVVKKILKNYTIDISIGPDDLNIKCTTVEAPFECSIDKEALQLMDGCYTDMIKGGLAMMMGLDSTITDKSKGQTRTVDGTCYYGGSSTTASVVCIGTTVTKDKDNTYVLGKQTTRFGKDFSYKFSMGGTTSTGLDKTYDKGLLEMYLNSELSTKMYIIDVEQLDIQYQKFTDDGDEYAVAIATRGASQMYGFSVDQLIPWE